MNLAENGATRHSVPARDPFVDCDHEASAVPEFRLQALPWLAFFLLAPAMMARVALPRLKEPTLAWTLDGLSLLLSFGVQFDCSADEILESRFIDFLALMQIDGAPQRSRLGEDVVGVVD